MTAVFWVIFIEGPPGIHQSPPVHRVNTLHHNGVIVPPKYKARGLTVNIKCQPVSLSDEQEEIAVAWAKKVGTPYVEDPNRGELPRGLRQGTRAELIPGDVDFTAISDWSRERSARRS